MKNKEKLKEDNFAEDEIAKRKKLPKEVKNQIFKSIFFNVITFIIMLLITLAINVSFERVKLSDFEWYIKIGQLVLAVIVVLLFEIAYRKDTMKIGFHAIEFGIFSVAVLFVPYMYILKSNMAWMTIILSIYFIYYIAKSIAVFIVNRHNYLRDNMSDVKEIVKEEKKSYLDEDSSKTLKKQKEEKAKKQKEEKLKNSENNNKNNTKTNNKTSKNKKGSAKKKTLKINKN